MVFGGRLRGSFPSMTCDMPRLGFQRRKTQRSAGTSAKVLQQHEIASGDKSSVLAMSLPDYCSKNDEKLYLERI
jgi:hypothetical protein